MSLKKKDLLVCGYTQQELADRLGVSQPLVSKWFSGRVIPRPETIYRLCEVLRMDHSELISFIYERNQKLAKLRKK